MRDRPTAWRPDRRSALTLAVVVLPVLVAVVRGLVTHRAPLGDNGLIALRADDVLTADHPWFGTWTSASLSTGIEFNNPSPLHFDALAVFVKPFGVAAGSILAAAALNIAAMVVAVRQGLHFGGRRGEGLMAVAAAGLAWTLGSEMLTDIWQPHNLVLPFLAFMACIVAVATGRWRSLAWAVGIGSMVMGAHLSFAYLVLVLLVAAVACAWWLDRGRREGREGWRVGVPVAVTVGLLAWLQPVLEQFFGYGEGNLSRVLQARSATDEPLGLRLGARLVAQVVALPPWWARSSFTESIPETGYSADGVLRPEGVVGPVAAALALAALFALLAVLLRAAIRRRERVVGALIGVNALAVVVALGTTMVMPAGVLGLAPHQLRWLWPISILTMLTIVDAIDVLWVRGRVTSRHRWTAAGVAATVLCVGNLPTHVSDLGPSASRDANGAIRSLMTQLDAVQLPGPTYFDGSTLVFAEPYSGPVLAALTQADQPIRAGDESFARQLGEHRRRRNDERHSLQVRQGDLAEGPLAEGETLLAVATGPDDLAVAVVLIELAVSGP